MAEVIDKQSQPFMPSWTAGKHRDLKSKSGFLGTRLYSNAQGGYDVLNC
ncbi:hypothetical protein QUB50_27265 [Microcoleus sp. A6-C5]